MLVGFGATAFLAWRIFYRIDGWKGISDIHAKTGRPALETVLTVLHAGGKFGDSGYKVSSGLHGVGLSVVNALAESLSVEVARDSHLHQMSFSRGAVASDMVRTPLATGAGQGQGPGAQESSRGGRV